MTGVQDIRTVAIVGSGLIGAGWALLFATSGRDVRLYDADPAARGRGLDLAARELAAMEEVGLCDDAAAALARILPCDTLDAAVAAADYVQESVFERIDVKRAACAAIDACLPAHAIVGSSSSGIPASAFTEELVNRARFFVVHPVNPPHLVPLVEIVPAPWSDSALVPVIHGLMTAIGQAPITVTREIDGFILNRLQGALLNEAWTLFGEGYASLADIDLAVSHGLGTRWSFIGPFETIDLNAPGGIADYAARLAPLYSAIGASRGMMPDWSAQTVARASEQRRATLPASALTARSEWRNRRLLELAARRRTEG
jgi:3-hydroxyacyl-CoA dehydrogenase